jgi:uncharacterized membrane protein
MSSTAAVHQKQDEMASSSLPFVADVAPVGVSNINSAKVPYLNPKTGMFHCMISYRVDPDDTLATPLYSAMQLHAIRKLKRLPSADQTMFPASHNKHQSSVSPFHVFFDKYCLKDAQNYVSGSGDGGFVGAITKALVFVPIFSTYPSGKGSLGAMSTLAKVDGSGQFQDWVDNVLLELIVAKELHQMPHTTGLLQPCAALYPLFANEAVFRRDLSNLPSKKTNMKAFELLTAANIPTSDGFLSQSVASVVNFYFSIQGLKLFAHQTGDDSLGCAAAAKKVFNVACSSMASFDQNSFIKKFGRDNPLFVEMSDWLTEQHASQFIPILAQLHVNSMPKLVSMRGQNNLIQQLAKEASEVTGKTEIRESLEVSKLIELASSHPLTQPLSLRMQNFNDPTVHWATALFCPSSLDLILCKPIFQRILALFAVVCSSIVIYNIETGRVRTLTFLPLVTFAISCTVVPSVAYFVSPSWGRRAITAFSFLLVASAFGALALYKCADGSCSIDQSEVCRTSYPEAFYRCRNLEIVYQSAMASFFLSCAITSGWFLKRFWVVFCIGVACLNSLAFGIDFSLGSTQIYQDAGLVIGVIIIYFLTRYFESQALQSAVKVVEEDAAIYRDFWRQVASSQDYQESEIELLTDIFGPAIDGKYIGKRHIVVRQPCNDISFLYQQGEFINDSFQRYVESWFSVAKAEKLNFFCDPRHAAVVMASCNIPSGSTVPVVVRGPVKIPSRAISKCYRCYQRQPAFITDIVRCRVNCQNISVVSAILKFVLEHGMVSGDSMDVSNRSLLQRIFSESNRHDPLKLCYRAEPNHLFHIIRCRNRYDNRIPLDRIDSGYRDCNLKLMMGYTSSTQGTPWFVPVSLWDSSTFFHVCEIQIVLLDPNSRELTSHQMHQRYIRMRDLVSS